MSHMEWGQHTLSSGEESALIQGRHDTHPALNTVMGFLADVPNTVRWAGDTDTEKRSHSYLEEGNALYHRHQQAEEGENCLEEASNAYLQALEYPSDAPTVDVVALCGLARVVLALGQAQAAKRYASRALEKATQLRYEAVSVSERKRWVAQSARLLGDSLRMQGDDDAALEVYTQAINVSFVNSADARLGWATSRISLLHTLPNTLRSSLALWKALGQSVHHTVIGRILSLMTSDASQGDSRLTSLRVGLYRLQRGCNARPVSAIRR